jgi:hypothetical protein
MSVAWVGAGIAAVGVVSNAVSSNKAAKAQGAAANQASATELEQYHQNREDMAPWRDAGEAALSQLTAGTAAGGQFARDFTLADFQRDPGYQFRMGQGTQALERSAAARGGALSGGSLKALSRYGQDYASNEYSNAYNRWNADRDRRFNRLSSLAGIGQTATTQTAAMGQQTASSVADNITSAGNARASGYVGQANAVNGGIGSMQNMYFMNKLLNNGGGSSSGSGFTNWGGGNGWATDAANVYG